MNEELRKIEEELAALQAKREALLAQDRSLAASTGAVTADDDVHQQSGGVSLEGERIAVKGSVIGRDNNSVTYILNQYLDYGQQMPDSATLRRQIDNYLTWLQDWCGTIELRGIKREGQQVVQLNLDTVYVPLEAELYERLEEESSHRLAMEREVGPALRSVELNQVLGLGQRLILTGGPGCGKTTVLLHIAWTLATAIATDGPGLAGEKLGLEGALPLPIFVPLSAYATYLWQLPAATAPHERTLAAFISRYLIEKQISFDLPEDFFQELMRDGRGVILLLDGLDEVPKEAERVRVRQAIEELVTGRETMRVVVTCRTAAYKDRTALGRGFREVRVKPLDEGHFEALVKAAYGHLYRHNPLVCQNKTEELLRGIRHLEEGRQRRLGKNVERLVTSPLLVRMLLVVHFSERRLPEQRAELYMKATDAMLLPEYAPDEEIADRLGQLVGGSREVHRELVQHLAFAMHSRGESQGREISEDELRRVMRGIPGYEGLVDDFIALTRLRGTLLEERLGVYRFIHLAFQEFMAARYLAEVRRGEAGVEGIAAFFEEGPILDSWWREPVLLVAGYLSVTTPQTARLFVRRLGGLDEGASERNEGLSADAQVAGTELAATAALEWQAGYGDLRREMSMRLASIFQETDLMNESSLVLRTAAGDVLARLGDPRPGVGLRPDSLPDIVWCEVPDGPFLVGSTDANEMADDWEKPQHKITLPAFSISKYSVTNAQYAAFVTDGGYTEKWQQCWTEAGWTWKGDRIEPGRYRGIFGLPNHPVVLVTWYEAVAFCAWLTERLRAMGELGPDDVVRLPSEREWEKAARGTDGRIYPWGDKADSNRANYSDIGIGTTSTVGCFLGGASPYGVLDLSGNVWEWCATKWQDNYESYQDDCDLEGDARRVLRGGAFNDFARHLRCAFRGWHTPNYRNYHVGFRVVVARG